MFTDPVTLLDRARRYREKASALRQSAATAGSQSVKEALLQAADSFDVLGRAAMRQAQWVRRAHELVRDVQSHENAASPHDQR